MSQMKCKCGRTLEMQDPIWEVINGNHISMIVFNHAVMNGKCPHCGFEFMGAIVDFDMNTLSIKPGVVPRPKAKDEPMIQLAPDGLDVRKLPNIF